MSEIEEILKDEVTQIGAGAAAVGVATQVPAIASGVSTVAGVLGGVKIGATVGSAVIALGAAPVAMIGGGLLLVGIGVTRVFRK